ncbi:MAG TPA: dihydrofolate reductase family protein, partial [Rhizomicrobium sp.]
MRILRALMHVSLDGYCAGPKGEMNWITLNDAIFADVHRMIEGTGAAVYGRTTYGMMRGYWPTLLDKTDADPEQRKHAHWVEQIPKHTFSRTLR